MLFRRLRAAALTALCAAFLALVIPGLAAAETFEVTSTGDLPQPSKCLSHDPANCSLRGAIVAANVDAGRDVIHFRFHAESTPGVISIGGALPAITEAVEIDAERCPDPPRYVGPCAEVGLAGTGEDVFTIAEAATETTIRNLAISGGRNGIVDKASGFVATGDWLGFDIEGVGAGNAAAGIVVGPGAEGATIGGTDELDRNVFGFGAAGIVLEGASHTAIEGNYIGVEPDGITPAALPVGVRIVDTEGAPGVKALENEVGGVLTKAQADSNGCDGACNVIVTERGTAIDLAGESGEPVEAASGPTTIRGNFIGLAADGLTAVGENEYGVLAAPTGLACGAGPENVTVGGRGFDEANLIEGSGTGIFAEGAEGFVAIGNAIGIAADGSKSESPGIGIALCGEGVTDTARVEANEMILGPDAIGIESASGEAFMRENTITGSQTGILTVGESEGHGDLISGNTIIEPDVRGIQILNQSNLLIGNTIERAGNYGIQLEGEADQNVIGGDSGGGGENRIDGSGSGAIVISGTEEERNEIGANNGAGNAGPFIQLFAQGAGERLNGGIQPPVFSGLLPTVATGTAAPGATVRVFRKLLTEAGELASLLAVVTADSSGRWTASFASLPAGTLVAATATSEAGTRRAGTSEVSAPVAVPAEPEAAKGGGSTQPGPSHAAPPAPVPPKAPRASITKAPKKSSAATVATFKFKAIPAAGAKFECKLDAAKWAGCKSPKTLKGVKPGKHTFRVRAKAAGLTGPVAKYKFTVRP
jgi:Periplasmic copper-binding protein (NosD)